MSLISNVTGDEKGFKFHKILFSDVVVKKRRNFFWGRKWTYIDIIKIVTFIALHILCLFAPSTFNLGALFVAIVLIVIIGLFGITLSYHRNLTHKSFKIPKLLEYFFAYCGVQSLQGDPIEWVSAHRYHHQFVDSDRDPHSPIEGFWFSHMSWFYDTTTIFEKCGKHSNVADLKKQFFYKFIRRTYIFHPLAFGALLYSLGGFPYVVWGMGVRTVWLWHVTFLVNSACHVWGKQSWNTGDLSRNNWWVALVTYGEGWHNNHHAFEYSARQGLEWYQFDPTWYVIRLLEAIGLATDVKLPTKSHKKRMAFTK